MTRRRTTPMFKVGDRVQERDGGACGTVVYTCQFHTGRYATVLMDGIGHRLVFPFVHIDPEQASLPMKAIAESLSR